MNSLNNNVVIAGCGNVGSNVANIISKSMERDYILFLYDSDVLCLKNFPYLHLSSSRAKKEGFLGAPKSTVLAHMLTETATCIINPIQKNYVSTEQYNLDYFKIDCRDNSDNQEKFDIKLCCDGPIGKIIIKPPTSTNSSVNNYRLGSNKFYTMLFAFHVFNFLNTENLNEYTSNTEFFFDLKSNKVWKDTKTNR